jgi:hypothetical protein
MRYKFKEVFLEDDKGLTPLFIFRFKHNIWMSPSITFRKGQSFGGIDIYNFKGKDIEMEENSFKTFKGYYDYGKSD